MFSASIYPLSLQNTCWTPDLWWQLCFFAHNTRRWPGTKAL